MIDSFFRFGTSGGRIAVDSSIKSPQSHYLIYAITDLDAKQHYTYSYGDSNTLTLLEQAAELEYERDPSDVHIQQLLIQLDKGAFPPPTKVINGACRITPAPFKLDYGTDDSLNAVPKADNTFSLVLGGDAVRLTFVGSKPPMLVNGDGNTGLKVRTDMKYMSLTRCSVAGSIDTGSGPESATGCGWFDHQWGNSWTTQSAGWDWFGVQLANGTDILFFRQIDMKTGAPFFPCATFEDSSGKQVTTHNIVFQPAPDSTWISKRTGVAYPLDWTVSFPDQRVTLAITPDMLDQEMPVLANGGAIWEGSCSVTANVNGTSVPGSAYMELVGYSSPAVRATVIPAPASK
jgi:hypothetical protein